MTQDQKIENLDLTMSDGSIITVKCTRMTVLDEIVLPSLAYCNKDAGDYIDGTFVLAGPHHLKENDDGR